MKRDTFCLLQNNCFECPFIVNAYLIGILSHTLQIRLINMKIFYMKAIILQKLLIGIHYSKIQIQTLM